MDMAFLSNVGGYPKVIITCFDVIFALAPGSTTMHIVPSSISPGTPRTYPSARTKRGGGGASRGSEARKPTWTLDQISSRKAFQKVNRRLRPPAVLKVNRRGLRRLAVDGGRSIDWDEGERIGLREDAWSQGIEGLSNPADSLGKGGKMSERTIEKEARSED